ncbi:hypothetical protein [Xylella fastidiosa]|uniref:hypothetical protein n=1 Tax=Xylella fastidiosa TaxID=2371 RepID=UPI001E5DA5D1|nr:hypothetical protein [Xylella fastidiosa]
MSPYVGVNGWHIFAYIPLEEGTPSNVIGVAEKAGSVGGEAIAGQHPECAVAPAFAWCSGRQVPDVSEQRRGQGRSARFDRCNVTQVRR